MNKFKGTRGTWEVHESRSRGFCITSGGFGEGMKVVSGCVDEYDHLGSINNIHDATLIAAAPDLLEALVAMESAIENWEGLSYSSRYGLVNQARAAIVKAQGVL